MSIGIHCCKDCPKREIGCHATCKEYLKEKVQYEEDKKKVKADMDRIPDLKNDWSNRLPIPRSKRYKSKHWKP